MIKTADKTLAELCLAASAKYKDRPALAMIRDGEIYRQITYTQMGRRVRQIALLLRQMGVKKGGRVLLFSENCPEWPLFYFGINLAGAVSVPLLPGFSAEQVINITDHASISVMCLSRKLAEKLKPQDFSLNSSVNSHSPFIYIDSIINEKITVSINGAEKQVLLHRKEEKYPQYNQGNPNDLATIIYTSGTQGYSKGVMLSSANLISSALATISFKKIFKRDRLLSVLPLAHAYECSIGLLAPVISGASIGYLDRPPSPSVLLPAVKLLRPTMMLTVPLLIEKVYRNTIAPKLRGSKLYTFPPTRALALWVAGRKLVSALGGRIRVFGIGGGPLSAEVEQFLRSARFPYNIGYGLSEAAPLITGTRPHRFPVHSVGTAARGVTIRITCTADSGEEGEIQVRGPNVMLGYYNDKEQTTEAFTPDGWLRTGDLGRFDKKSRLYIKGRLKALIVGPSGENIYPEEIEDLLGSSQLVEDVLVYSGEKGELVALVKLSDAAKAATGAIGHSIEHSLEELRTWANKKLAVFSHLSRIEIRHEPFEKTPTMKIKRYLYA